MAFLFGFLAILGIIYLVYMYRQSKRKELKIAVNEWANKPLHNWDATMLASKRLRTDKLADDAIEQLFASDNPAHINSFYNGIQRNSSALPDDLPAYLKDYFNQNETLPSWANPVLIKQAENFFLEHGELISLVLCAKSLPECYACANGAMVLYQTGRLSEHNGSLTAFTRRIAETAQFVINVMTKGALSPRGNGIRSAQKVRLIHASIRYYIKKQGWDESKYGKPINQEDMAGTLMSFAPLVIEGLETLGEKISKENKEAYFHAWRVVGYFMGLDEDLLPNNLTDAFALGNAIFNAEKAKSEQGLALTKSLIHFMNSMAPHGEMALIVNDLIRMLVGDETANLLEIPASSKTHEEVESELAKKILGGWENFEERHAILKLFIRPINKVLLNGMLRVMNQGEKITFFIPPSLQEDWGLTEKSN